MSDLNLDEIISSLKTEISVITGKKTEELHTEQSLAFNGINSMGFVELLLSIHRIWNVNLMEAGIGISDVRTLRALAEKIKQEIQR